MLIPLYYLSGGNVQMFLIARYGLTMLWVIGFLVMLGRPGVIAPRPPCRALASGVLFGAASLLVLGSFRADPGQPRGVDPVLHFRFLPC